MKMLSSRFPKPSRSSLRSTFLFAVLAAALALQAYIVLHVRSLENELQDIARAKVREIKGAFEMENIENLTSSVTAAQQYVVFGETIGKVSVFVRLAGPTGPKHYKVIDYFYVRNGHGWQLQDSGICGDPEIQERAILAFAKTM